MKYVGVLYDNIIISKAKNYDDKIHESEIELTEGQYNTIPIPCKLVDGEFVPCEYPKINMDDDVETETEPTEVEQLRADIDFIAIMTGVEL